MLEDDKEPIETFLIFKLTYNVNHTGNANFTFN